MCEPMANPTMDFYTACALNHPKATDMLTPR